MAQNFDDFSGYSNGNIGTVSGGNWSTIGVDANWPAAVETDAGATGGKVLTIQDDGQDWGDQEASILDEVLGAQSGDIEVVGRYKIATIGSEASDAQIGPALMDASGNCYCVRITGTTSVQGAYFQGGTLWAHIGSAVTVTTIGTGYVWCRIGRSGTTIRLKFWADGETEPASWQASATDTNIGSCKGAFTGADFDASPFTLDVIGIGTAGDAAPTSSGGGGAGQPFPPSLHRRPPIPILRKAS